MIASSPASTGTYDQLLKKVAEVSRFNPEPVLLFDFADGQSCSQLTVERERIAQAGGCSKEDTRCFEGTPQQLP